MLYNSTRNNSLSVTSAEAIKMGLSPDGGLFVPESFPSVSEDELKSLINMSYSQRAALILGKYLTDFTEDEVLYCVNNAYSKDKWASDDITPVKKLNDDAFFLELWHGMTCAFKDVALQILPHLLTTSVKKTNDSRTAVILVATSGDTGKAALEGFKDVKGTKIAVFYPSDGVSDIQKLQMTTQDGSNVTVSGIKGNFDDAQTAVKRIFTNDGMKELLSENNMMFSSANSINWGRLAPQIVYYFSAYCDMVKTGDIAFGDKINFVVPTGNFGDILAGYYAFKMGLPVNRLICASNKNNVLTDFINTGIYNKNREFYTTSSPSMDILISSNLERFLYDISEGDDAKIKGFMESLSRGGKYEIDDKMKSEMRKILYGGFCDDDATKAEIKSVFNENGYTMDTHTAVGKNVYDKYRNETGDNTKTVILSTASPFKFSSTVVSAIKGENAVMGKDGFELLDMLSDISGLKIPKSLNELKNKKVKFGGTVDKTEIDGFVKESLI